ncbi:UNVERIFIED_CONTAM: hypothetical protein FKN15_068250 [Acipenser sinensis]
MRTLYTEMRTLYTEMHTLYTEMRTLYTEMRTLYTEMHTLYTEMRTLYTELHTLYTEICYTETQLYFPPIVLKAACYTSAILKITNKSTGVFVSNMKFLELIFIFVLSSAIPLVQSNNEDIIEYFMEVRMCLGAIRRYEFTNYFIIHQHTYRNLEDHLRVISAILYVWSEHDGSGIQELLTILENMYSSMLQLHSNYLSLTTPRVSCHSSCVLLTHRSGRCGRPRFEISAEQINYCVSLGLSWQNIARCFGISRTLYCRRLRTGIEPHEFSAVSDYQLDTVVSEILSQTPNAGETYVIGSLRSRGLHVQRWRIRQSLQHLDPVGRAFRRRRAIRRRAYNVLCPNQLC